MKVSIPLDLEIDNEAFLRNLNLKNKEPIEILQTLAYGDVPKLNEYLSDFLRDNEKTIIEYLRLVVALEVGKEYTHK